MIQFDYEIRSYFGNHIKVLIEDNVLKYRQYMVDFSTRAEWVTPDIPEEKISDFLDSLESLDGCIEDYRNDSVLEGTEYIIICHTENIHKKIRGYHEYQSTVRQVLEALPRMDDGLREALDFQ